MTYYWFGGGPGARKPDVYLEDPASGARLANTSVTVRDGQSGATLTDFLDSSGQAATQIVSDSEGYLTFAATASYVYVDGGAGTWAFYSDGAVADAIAVLPQLDSIQASASASAFSASQAQAAAEAAAANSAALTPLDISKAQPKFLARLTLAGTEFMQHAYKDPTTGDFYASMNLPGTQSGRESVLVSHCAPDGSLLDSMTLTDAGHGNNLNYERIGSNIHIWVNWQEALVAGQGNQLVRVQYRPGASLARAETSYFTTVNKFASGATNTDIAIDFANDWVAQRVSTDAGTTDTYRRRRWSEMLAGVDKVYNSIGPIALSPPIMQGMATIGDDLYWYEGGNDPAVGDKQLVRVSWLTGQVTATVSTGQLGRLADGSVPGNYQEPEGASVFVDPGSGAASLIAGVVTGTYPNRVYSLFAFAPVVGGLTALDTLTAALASGNGSSTSTIAFDTDGVPYIAS